MTFETQFALGEIVNIDSDPSIKGRIMAVCFRTYREATYEVAYVHNGTPQAPWIEECRLTRMPPHD